MIVTIASMGGSTTMTTSLPPTPRAPATQKAGNDLRLHLTSVLALTYLLAWWSFGMRANQAAAPPEPRPATGVPGGSTRTASVREAPPQVRPAAARPVRIRTRSS